MGPEIANFRAIIGLLWPAVFLLAKMSILNTVDCSSDTVESLNLVPIPVLILLSGVDSESNARIFIFLMITLRLRFREYLRSSTIPSLSKHKLFQSLVLRRDWTKCLGVFIPRWDNRSYSISSSRQYTTSKTRFYKLPAASVYLTTPYTLYQLYPHPFIVLW